MNNPDHISESLETSFWVNILKLFDADLVSGMGKKIRIRIRDEQPGSYIRDLGNNFWGKKILQFFDADPIRDPESFSPGQPGIILPRA